MTDILDAGSFVALLRLSPKEMDKLAWLWQFHRKDCDHKGDVKLELSRGSGIGTTAIATCGCGKELDITDYYSW